jgi:predicted nucleic acid-binding protein
MVDSNKYSKITKDVEVLANAIESNIDIFITGDNDFYDIDIDKPRIIKPSQYQNEFMN